MSMILLGAVLIACAWLMGRLIREFEKRVGRTAKRTRIRHENQAIALTLDGSHDDVLLSWTEDQEWKEIENNWAAS